MAVNPSSSMNSSGVLAGMPKERNGSVFSVMTRSMFSVRAQAAYDAVDGKYLGEIHEAFQHLVGDGAAICRARYGECVSQGGSRSGHDDPIVDAAVKRGKGGVVPIAP